MAPFGAMGAAAVSLLAKSIPVFCCSSRFLAARSVGVLPLSSRCLMIQVDGPPKRPLNAYIRFVVQQRPHLIIEHPDLKLMDLSRKMAQQWRTMSEEQKRPFQEQFQLARDQFRADKERYQAQLSPAQAQQLALEKKQKLAKKKQHRRKREMNSLGKPKRTRSSFNIFMSEHFAEARGATVMEKMKALVEEWKNMLGDKRQVYMQLAQDDKIRYKNEMQSWEEHMVDIGRQDVLRGQPRSRLKEQKKSAPKMATKAGQKSKSKAGKRTTARSSK